METAPAKRRGRPPKAQPTDDSKDWMKDISSDPVPITTAQPQVAPKAAATPAQPFERVFAGQTELNHDLFKLEAANLIRNASYNIDNPIFENVEHAHFFHSIDSRGRKQEFSNKVGGHFHAISINPDGTAVCSGPLIEIKRKKYGRVHTEYLPIGHDQHIHKVTYRFSEKVKPATINAEWAKVQANVANIEAQKASIRIDDVQEND